LRHLYSLLLLRDFESIEINQNVLQVDIF